MKYALMWQKIFYLYHIYNKSEKSLHLIDLENYKNYIIKLNKFGI